MPSFVSSPAHQRSKSAIPPSVVPSTTPTRPGATALNPASARAAAAARSAKAPARSGSATTGSRTSAATRGSRSSAGNAAIGAIADRPATSASKYSATPAPSGDTTPAPVITGARDETGNAGLLSHAHLATVNSIDPRLRLGSCETARLSPGTELQRHAPAREAGAADFPERTRVCLEPAPFVVHTDSLGASLRHVCRAGFAGRGTTVARVTERHTLASGPDPRRSLGSAT